MRMRDEEGCILLDQYCNPGNPLAHYDQLAEEILYQCDGKIDVLVIGAGTGGTIAGVARKFKEKSPNTVVVAADPYGSVLALPPELNTPAPPNKVEGIGYDFLPRTCARESIDFWVKTDDPESFLNARELIRKEGLLVGGSAGAVLFAATEFLRKKGWDADPTKRVVMVFSDSIRNYITKFLSKEWCIESGFIPYSELSDPHHRFATRTLSDLKLAECAVYETLTVKEAKEQFEAGAKIIGLKKDNRITGALFPRKFLELVCSKRLKLDDPAWKAKTNEFVVVPHTLDAVQLSKLLERNEAMFVEERSADGLQIVKTWVATPQDALRLIE